MTTKIVLLAAIVSLSVTACDKGSEPKKDDAPGASTSAQAAAQAPTAAAQAGEGAAAPAGEGKCAALGCKGEGDFFKKCDCKGKDVKPPFTIKYTGKYNDFAKKPEFEVTNTSDKPTHWGSAAVYYYDKSGKQLSAKIKETTYPASRVNGSNFTFKPGETKKLTLGFDKDAAPKDTDAMQVVIDGWCYGTYDDKASYLCINLERAPDERPKAN